MIYFKKISLNTPYVTTDINTANDIESIPQDIARHFLKENGFCTDTRYALHLETMYRIAVAIKESEKNSIDSLYLLEDLIHRISPLAYVDTADIRQMAPDSEKMQLALRACYLMFKDLSRPITATNKLRFIRDYIRFGGMPFSREISTSIHQHFQPLLPINSLKNLNHIHRALRSIVPHADPSEYCFSRCVWVVDQLQKLGLTVGTIKVKQPWGLHPPKYKDQNIVWQHHIAPTVDLTSFCGLVSTTYILDSLLEKVVQKNKWLEFIGIQNRLGSITEKSTPADIPDFLKENLENETWRLKGVY